eukprot:3944331-Pyramimonas_sp.AAC.1
MRPRSAVLGGGDACGAHHWGLRWTSLRGHTGWGRRMRYTPLGPEVDLPMGPRNAFLGGGDACGTHHWGLRWGSLWGHEA